jgi:hypothetical protein
MTVRFIGMAVVLAALSFASEAVAGTYTVSGCKNGWVADVRNSTGPYAVGVYDNCPQPSPGVAQLLASLGGAGRINAGDYAAWRFDAPTDTAIVATSLTWKGLGEEATADHGADVVALATSSGESIQHLGRFAVTETLPARNARGVRSAITCLAEAGSTRRGVDSGDATNIFSFAISGARVTLLDRLSPDVSRVGGSAIADHVWTGQEPVSFDGSDRGGGVFRVDVDVDGATIQTLPVVSDDRCVAPDDSREFAYPVPCPPAVSAVESIQTAQLPQGVHSVALYVEDVAGDRSVIMPPTDKLIVDSYRAVGYFSGGSFFNPRFAAPRVLNGNGATSNAKLTAAFARRVGRGRARHRVLRATREVRYAQRATVVGTLRAPSGEPISGATVFIGQRPEGQQWRLEGAVRTDAHRGFRYQPAARQSNRRLRAVYFPFSDSHENAVSPALTLNVRAGMTLHVNRHSLHNGDRLIFTGRVLGPVPAAGVAVTLQAKVGRHYRSFRQLRATSRTGGRIHTVYRFERTTQPARYRFRLKVVRQAGLPFQSGVSPVVSVSVSP